MIKNNRLLCIISCMNTGGAETFLMKMFRVMDKEKYSMDFCVNSDDNYYSDEISRLGGKIYVIPSKSKNMFKSFNAIKQIVKNNNYKYVIRVNEHSLSVLDLLAAKAGGATELIMRSSNASSPGKLSRTLHKMFKFLPILVPNKKIAPSELAAQYTFGKKALKENKVVILHNGLEINKFAFNLDDRMQYRKLLGVEDKVVIGHVGRFSNQKNHKFLIQIFRKIKDTVPNSVLLLVGQGELESEIKNEIALHDLDDSVKFLGVRKDIPQLLSTMDGFVFPSLYEGMPNTVIEAQTNGLPCLISDTITKEAAVTKLVDFENINNDPSIWSNKIINMINKNSNKKRINASIVMKQNNYDVAEVIRIFEHYIFED